MVESQLTIINGSTDHVLVVGIGGVYQRPVVDPEPFRSDTTSTALPRVRTQPCGERVDLDCVGFRVSELCVLRYGHHIGDAVFREVVAQAGVLAEFLIRGEPGERHTRPTRSLDHLADLRRSGAEHHVRWNTGLGAPCWISDPGFLR